MEEKGRTWLSQEGIGAGYITDWIDAVMPQLDNPPCYTVYDRYGQPMVRMRLDGFMRPNGLSMTEFSVTQIFQYLDDEVAKRLGAQ